ncbi:MAG: divergent polysaccharide deacetylase family protein [bacterium]
MSLPRFDSKGRVGVPLLVLFLCGIAFGAFWFYRFRMNRAPVTTRTPAASSSAFQGDASRATTQLVSAVNQQLESLDVLKLLTEPVQEVPVTVQGKVFSTYRESFRLPARYSPDDLAALLTDTVQAQGARRIGQDVRKDASGLETFYDYSFGFEPGWVPLQITWVETRAPKVCLIIDDGGYQEGKALEALYQFKVPVTVSVIPDVIYSKDLASQMPSHGIEVMCHMPMKGHEADRLDNYKEFLKPGMPAREVGRILNQALDALPGCVGMNNHMGSKATEDADLMLKVCQVLKGRGLYLIDSRTTAKSMAAAEAVKTNLVHAERNVFLDDVVTAPAILAQLNRLVRYARKHGTAVGIGHFKVTSLETLRDAIPKLKAEGIQFIYASEAVK